MKISEHILLVCLFCFIYTSAQSQSNTKIMDNDLETENTLISRPNEIRYVSSLPYLMLPNGTYIHWYVNEIPFSEVDFKTTNLIFAGGVCAFQEHFPIKTADISSLKIVSHSIDYTAILSPQEKILYILSKNQQFWQINVSGYQHVRQMIFKYNGKLFFAKIGDYGLHEITIPVDEVSLQHVFSNYYIDKNGLYYFDVYGKKTQQLESSNGKFIQPILYEKYFIYNDAAYPYANAVYNQKDLRLNANELKFIYTPYGQYLGDKNKLFALPYNINNTLIGASILPQHIIQKNMPQEPINEWNCFDIITVGGNLKDNVLYYSSAKTYAGSGRPHSLIKTPNGFYGIVGSTAELEAVKFDDVMIYNIEKDDYESIEVDKFRRLTTNFYIYKNQLYCTDSNHIKTEVDIEKLQPILLDGKATEFFTDGTFLLGGYNLNKAKMDRAKNPIQYEFEMPLFSEIDWESLHVVRTNLMVDKNHIYQIENTMLQVIPISKLGFDVKILRTEKFN